jgi:hypothetical protein
MPSYSVVGRASFRLGTWESDSLSETHNCQMEISRERIEKHLSS